MMLSATKAKVIIPVYKTEIEPDEWLSVHQCFKILSHHHILFVAPEGLDLSHYQNQLGDIQVEYFPAHYFANIEGYNALMLSTTFYERFLDVEYLLIYQTDAYVFKDELSYWCSQGYDYIGAPWLPVGKYLKFPKYWFARYRAWYRCKSAKHKTDTRRLDFRVGNGGFSLRRVQCFHRITQSEGTMIEQYKSLNQSTLFNEDVFWGIEMKKKYGLKIPGFRTAMRFAVEHEPDYCYRCNKQQLPFGCHAWRMERNYSFWDSLLRRRVFVLP